MFDARDDDDDDDLLFGANGEGRSGEENRKEVDVVAIFRVILSCIISIEIMWFEL